MKQSQYFIPTLKEAPNEAVIPSHILMIRSGLVRSLGSGIYSFLPMGYRIMKKIMNIIREEMDAIGGLEFHMPALNPSDLWEQTGRRNVPNFILSVKERDLVLAPTHEEVIAFHARADVKSYKELPQIWYQIQTKFRNEPRPRSGVLRGRQFTMKDAYSLDSSWEGLDISYDKHAQAYRNIFSRCGLKFFAVGASSGAMGGSASQEFMLESFHGEDTCVLCDETGYAANLEVATSALPPIGRIDDTATIEQFATPNSKTINQLVEDFQLDVNVCAKSVVYIVDSKPYLFLLRGNDELNESKVQTLLTASDLRPATEEELVKFTGANGGSIGPIGLKSSEVTIIADSLLRDANGLVSGANENGFHYRNIDFSRDVPNLTYADLRIIQEGEPEPSGTGAKLRITNAIEIGHIFKLGTKYSIALGAKFLDMNGKDQPIIMGSYGIGVERILACFIEQHHDEKGIIWGKTLAPFAVHILGIGLKKSERVREYCDTLYNNLRSAGIEVLFDDRDISPGFKLNDADLLGMPLQVVVGEKNAALESVEVKVRSTGEKQIIAFSEAMQTIQSLLTSLD
jgi:prolyl-tRNA synthetase